ncbi:MAG: hypothetical protein M3R51_04810 [Candidatus Eremiobacteraeota bacterium]|nr:hypothetical protein [Candidatus Eremiobacteraeota bacterium]
MFSNSPAFPFLAVLFVAGAALFALGTWLARRRPEAMASAQPAVSALLWTRSVTGSDEVLPAALRLDVIERLALVGEPWCVSALREAASEETDAQTRDAAERALLVIACRPDPS